MTIVSDHAQMKSRGDGNIFIITYSDDDIAGNQNVSVDIANDDLDFSLDSQK